MSITSTNHDCPIDHEDVIELLRLVISMIVNRTENQYVQTNTIDMAIQILEIKEAE